MMRNQSLAARVMKGQLVQRRSPRMVIPKTLSIKMTKTSRAAGVVLMLATTNLTQML